MAFFARHPSIKSLFMLSAKVWTIIITLTIAIGLLVIVLFAMLGFADEDYRVGGAEWSANKLLSLKISGVIVGDSDGFFMEGLGLTPGYAVKQQLYKAAENPSIKGVVLEIASPGGTINGAKAIADGVAYYREQTKHPVYAHVQGLGASGGYWAAASADKVIADAGSDVGSIGVIMGPFKYYDKVLSEEGLDGAVMTQNGINIAALNLLHNEEVAYTMLTTGSENYVEQLKRSCLAPEELVLKEGALVMCIKNAQDKKYVNGSLGVVIDFEEVTDYPIVKLRNGKVLTIRPDVWELRDGTKKRASLTQIPLRLAWAITIHKSQGMTLDAARIDLRKAFVEGMGYVALSRVKQLDSLSLLGINKKALQVSPDALAINERLLEKSAADHERFKHLEKKAAARKVKTPPKPSKPTSAWAERVAEMRKTYPRAFMPWKKEEDATLQTQFKDGVGVQQLSEVLGRQPGGVRARLKKHFGEEVELKP